MSDMTSKDDQVEGTKIAGKRYHEVTNHTFSSALFITIIQW